ncbi:hypothetical protein ATK17_3214 [Branchiibius hedensis]|uniref:Uncharacterized protein n=1 Tax=Branchiibius hedensis TaxID=672460 RepID=A0A2Y8ZZZ7_9MICO|nr:DUF6584 family protein [Branchiibius hedensis]PWJ27028.1 hypothetical protein ATK17_3214 [Branchiibius hedensis]SSA35839.1 hypothetical protein SAMN04489750_3214 [Branchiibius hedensis]
MTATRTGAIERARDDLASGRTWKARDRLRGAIGQRQDDEIVDLLAQVYFEMQDLPAAGALWFVTGRDDERARAAVAAWEERYGDPNERWHTIPGPIRRNRDTPGMRALRPESTSSDQSISQQELAGSWIDGLLVLLIVVGFGALVTIGAWTVLHWIFR